MFPCLWFLPKDSDTDYLNGVCYHRKGILLCKFGGGGGGGGGLDLQIGLVDMFKWRFKFTTDAWNYFPNRLLFILQAYKNSIDQMFLPRPDAIKQHRTH